METTPDKVAVTPDQVGLAKVQAFIEKMAARQTEAWAAVWLDKDFQPVNYSIICEGTYRQVEVDFMKLIELARERPWAVHVVLAHNHPKAGIYPGAPLPSDDDMNSTRAGKMFFGAWISDDIIIAGNTSKWAGKLFSFKHTFGKPYEDTRTPFSVAPQDMPAGLIAALQAQKAAEER